MITTKGLKERKIPIEWDDGGKIGNKNILILLSTSLLVKILKAFLPSSILLHDLFIVIL